jgi:hypothetical protein
MSAISVAKNNLLRQPIREVPDTDAEAGLHQARSLGAPSVAMGEPRDHLGAS